MSDIGQRRITQTAASWAEETATWCKCSVVARQARGGGPRTTSRVGVGSVGVEYPRGREWNGMPRETGAAFVASKSMWMMEMQNRTERTTAATSDEAMR